MTKNGNVPDTDEHEDHVDGCICDIELDDDEITPDGELPAAAGGVEAAREEHADEDDVDGCDVDFNEFDPTTDEELPVAAGGVEEGVA